MYFVKKSAIWMESLVCFLLSYWSVFISNPAYGYFFVVDTFAAMSANENQCAIFF